MPSGPDNGGILRTLREHPDNAPLPSPSGRIEIASRRIESFGYADCPGHPAWREPADAPDERHPLWLVANQPATRLHSQLNFRGHSAGAKLHGREVIRLHPADAAERGVSNDDIVRVFDDRGACSAAAALTADIRHGVAQLPTGAWLRSGRPCTGHGALHSWESKRADARCGHVQSGTRVHGATHNGASRAVYRRPSPVRAYDPPEGATWRPGRGLKSAP